MGWFTDMMGMGNAQRTMGSMDPNSWNYDSTSTGDYYNSGGYLKSAMSNLSGQAGRLNNQANQFGSRANEMFGYGEQFIDPNSDYYNKQRGFLREDITGATADASRQMNQMMASRGVGSGGIRGALEATNASQVGEQVRRGSNDLYKQGMGQAGTLFGLGMQGLQGQSAALSSAGNMMNMSGQFGQALDNRDLSLAQSKSAAINSNRANAAQNQKDAWMMRYNNAAAQDSNAAGLWGGALGFVGSLGGGWLAGR